MSLSLSSSLLSVLRYFRGLLKLVLFLIAVYCFSHRNPSIPLLEIYPPHPVTVMASTNHIVTWPTKRLPPNNKLANSAKKAASDIIGQGSRQPGGQPPSQEQLPDNTRFLDQYQTQTLSPNQRQQHCKQPGGQAPDSQKQFTPASERQAKKPRPHSQRQGAARGTRSAASQEIVSAFEWEALKLEKEPPTPPIPVLSAGNSTKSRLSAAEIMSRNRPRGPPLPRDNGLAVNEETDMWNKILQDLRKTKEKNDKQRSLSEQITVLNEKIGRDGGSKFAFLFHLFPYMHLYLFQGSSSFLCLQVLHWGLFRVNGHA